MQALQVAAYARDRVIARAKREHEHAVREAWRVYRETADDILRARIEATAAAVSRAWEAPADVCVYCAGPLPADACPSIDFGPCRPPRRH